MATGGEISGQSPNIVSNAREGIRTNEESAPRGTENVLGSAPVHLSNWLVCANPTTPPEYANRRACLLQSIHLISTIELSPTS